MEGGVPLGRQALQAGLQTTDEGRASPLLGRINANLYELKMGRLEFPEGSDLLAFR